jgi:outer membrane biosynthesis protein TonB
MVSLLLLGYEAVGAQRLGLLNLQAWWHNDQDLLVSQVGWHALMGSFDRGIQALMPAGFLMPGIVILTLVCWLAWGYALVFILRQSAHSRVGGDSLAWLGALFVLPAALILLPLLYIQLVPPGQAAGQAGFLGVAIDLAAAAALIFLAGLLLLPRRIGPGVVVGQSLTWGLIYAVALWLAKMAGLPALGPLVMLLFVGLMLSLCLILALQRATAGLASFDDLGAAQTMEYALMVLAALEQSKDKIASARLAELAQVPLETTEEILQRLKDASLARFSQGRWAGVWPAERIQVTQVASALHVGAAPRNGRATPLVQKAQDLGWQGVSLADLIPAPVALVPAAPQAVEQELSPAPTPAEQPEPQPNPQPSAQPEPQPNVQPDPQAEPQADALEAAPSAEHSDDRAVAPPTGQRLVRSPEQSAPRHATPQSRALHLALGRAGETAADASGPGRSGSQAAEQGIIGAQDYRVLATGGAAWAARPTPGSNQASDHVGAQEVEPNDDSVTLDAIRREIQDLMDKS